MIVRMERKMIRSPLRRTRDTESLMDNLGSNSEEKNCYENLK